MKKLNVIIVILLQLNLLFLILNVFKSQEYNQRELMCYSRHDEAVKIVRMSVLDEGLVDETTEYYYMYKNENFKESLKYTTKFYTDDYSKEFINAPSYFLVTDEKKEDVYVYNLMQQYKDYKCTYKEVK